MDGLAQAALREDTIATIDSEAIPEEERRSLRRVTGDVGHDLERSVNTGPYSDGCSRQELPIRTVAGSSGQSEGGRAYGLASWTAPTRPYAQYVYTSATGGPRAPRS
jgi:hypothetical protein